MGFSSQLDVEQVRDFDWKLLSPLVYEGHTDRWTIEAGFETDFASSPRELWWLVPKSGRYTKAAVLHDYFWRTGGDPPIPKSDADGIFRRVMTELEVPLLQRWIMWAGVRLASLRKSWFRDGPGDIPMVLLVTFSPPGLLALLGALAVVVFLLPFLALEWIAAGLTKALQVAPPVKQRTKPVVRPKFAFRR